jgi:hypothetical protein
MNEIKNKYQIKNQKRLNGRTTHHGKTKRLKNREVNLLWKKIKNR